jgi:hypothetical protein
MAKITVSRPRSPTVAEELADVYIHRRHPDHVALHDAALRRASIVSGLNGGVRFTFEDGSCIQFLDDEILIDTNCKE